MARPRMELHNLLKTLDSSVQEVYFQPPNGLQMKYPCILYERDSATTKFADNKPHLIDTRYKVTVIDRNPDSAIPSKVASLPMCTFNRWYAADNLNHDVYTLYF